MIDATATGCADLYLPPGEQRDEIMGLIRMGLIFKAQHCGRRPGFLLNYLVGISRKINAPLTFDALLQELAFEARRRDLLGADKSPIEKVDRDWELVTYHDPKHGRVQLTFSALRGKLTKVKEILKDDSQLPLISESIGE